MKYYATEKALEELNKSKTNELDVRRDAKIFKEKGFSLDMMVNLSVNWFEENKIAIFHPLDDVDDMSDMINKPERMIEIEYKEGKWNKVSD